MKHFIRSKVFIVLMSLLLLVVFVGCDKTNPTLDFEKTEITVVEGDTFILTPIITDLEGEDLVNYTFNVEGVVSYKDGTFTALKSGQVVITATLKEFSEVNKTITVTVTAKPVKVTSITITGEETMVEGTTQTLLATVLPENADNKNVVWSTSDSSIASVDKGVVTALKPGEVTITVTAQDGSNVSKTLKITVTSKVITGEVSISGDKEEGFVGDTITLTNTVTTNAEDKSLTWTVDSDKATVEDGVVTLVKAGTVVVTATLNANETIKDTYTINIFDKVASIKITKAKEKYTVNDTETLSITVAPATAKQGVTWSSSDDTIVKVENGTITCLKAGTVTITATAQDGFEVTGTIEIEVINVQFDETMALVDASVSAQETGTEITFGGMKFYAGLNAFATLGEALSTSATKVYLAAGTYSEDVTYF